MTSLVRRPPPASLFAMLRTLCIFGAIAVPFVSAAKAPAPKEASTFAGSTQTFQFPPPNVTVAIPDPDFPNKSVVGFPGPTPSECLAAFCLSDSDCFAA